MNQHWLYYSIYTTQPTNLIVIGGWRGATGKKYFCRHDQMPTKCEHHQSSRKPQKDDVQRRQHQIYSAVQFSFKYKFIPCGRSNSNLSQLRDNKPQSEDFSSLKSQLSIPPQRRCNFIPSKLFLAACWSDRRAPSRCLVQFQSRSPEDIVYFLYAKVALN